MKSDDYITSGILHDYCLGFLTATEQRKVECMCQKYPQVATELETLKLAIQAYTKNNSPSEENLLRNKIWQSVKKIWLENE